MGSIGGGAPEIPEDPNERALAEIGGKEWGQYQTHGIPLENLARQRIERMKSAAARERFIGTGTASVEQAGGNEIEAGGVNPNSGMGARMASNRAVMKGRARTEAAIHGDQLAQDRYEQGRLGLIGLGRNQAAQGIQGLSRAAALGVQRNIGEASADMAERNAKHQLAGELTGFGLSYAALRNRNQIPDSWSDYEEWSGGIPYYRPGDEHW
jgi:hypothetical protein